MNDLAKNVVLWIVIAVVLATVVSNFSARTATPQEKLKLWSIMTAEWPDYDKYQRSTPRDIPLVILSPR